MVVTRQQVAGIERGRRGGCVCVRVCVRMHGGIQTGSWAFVRWLLPSYGGGGGGGGWRGGRPGDKASQQTGNEAAGDCTKSSTHTFDDPHTSIFTPSHVSTQAEHEEKEGEQTGTGSKIQLIHDRTGGGGSGKPSERQCRKTTRNNTPLPLDLCLCAWLCGKCIHFVDQGQTVFVMQNCMLVL